MIINKIFYFFCFIIIYLISLFNEYIFVDDLSISYDVLNVDEIIKLSFIMEILINTINNFFIFNINLIFNIIIIYNIPYNNYFIIISNY